MRITNQMDMCPPPNQLVGRFTGVGVYTAVHRLRMTRVIHVSLPRTPLIHYDSSRPTQSPEILGNLLGGHAAGSQEDTLELTLRLFL